MKDNLDKMMNLKEQHEGNKQLLQMVLEGTSVYEFYCYPLEKRIINSKRLSEKFDFPPVLENIPESFEWMAVGAEYANIIKEKYQSILCGEKSTACLFRTKDDKYWVRVMFSVVSCNEQGYPTYVVGILEDITREKECEIQFQTRIQTLEQRNREILLSVNCLYFAINSVNLETGDFQFIKCYEDMSSFQSEKLYYPEVISRTVKEFYHPEDAERFASDFSMEKLSERWSIGQDYFLGEYRRRVNGGWRWISCTAYFINKEFHQKVAVLALQDVHEQHINREYQRGLEKKKEEETRQLLKDALKRAQRASEAKSDFLSKMSHDIRTPMNAIIGMAALAENYSDNKEKVRECISKINVSGQHLMELINEVLDMSKIESGKMDLECEEFNLSELLQRTLSMMRTLMEQKGQQLIVSIRNMTHEEVVGDKLRLQQVFSNIMTNAHKYTQQGGTIRLTVEELPAKASQDGCYRFIFNDNGIGIEEEFLPHIFEPFSRAADSRTSKESGTGLGMTITYNIVHMMEGDIQVESEWGEGSTFTVTIPLHIKKQEDFVIEELVDKKVLVVDDEQICRKNLSSILEGIGMKCDTADSGDNALDKIKESQKRGNEYFAIIIDWAMPGLDGVETAEAIRRMKNMENTVIILCAYDWSSIADEAELAGVDEFIAKPLFKSQLIELFRRLCQKGRIKRSKKDIKNKHVQFEGKRILLVEDNEINMEIACEIISMTGAKVETAENGEVAVEKFKSSQEGYYHFIFMDIRMPVMNGYQATEKIRMLDRKDAKTVPIVAMTADAFSDDVRKALDAGMNEHLAKPIDVPNIAIIMEKWLK